MSTKPETLVFPDVDAMTPQASRRRGVRTRGRGVLVGVVTGAALLIAVPVIALGTNGQRAAQVPDGQPAPQEVVLEAHESAQEFDVVPAPATNDVPDVVDLGDMSTRAAVPPWLSPTPLPTVTPTTNAGAAAEEPPPATAGKPTELPRVITTRLTAAGDNGKRPVDTPAQPDRPNTVEKGVSPLDQFATVGGEGCQHSARQGFSKYGRTTDGTKGWYTRDGGWGKDGCSGKMSAIPMSGDPGKDGRSSVVWWFTPTTFHKGTCDVSVYVPKTGSDRDVAGRPAQYFVVRGKDDLTRLRSFTIDQTRNRGKWVSVGTQPLTNGTLAVQLVDRGRASNGEHIGAAQVSVSCRKA